MVWSFEFVNPPTDIWLLYWLINHYIHFRVWFVCWRSKDELISDVLLWTPTYGCAKVGRPARTYIQQLCEDTGCNPEDLPEAMNDREKWRERVRDIRAGGATWWWWWNSFSDFKKVWTHLSSSFVLNCTVLLPRRLCYWITYEGWFAIKQRNSSNHHLIISTYYLSN